MHECTSVVSDEYVDEETCCGAMPAGLYCDETEPIAVGCLVCLPVS